METAKGSIPVTGLVFDVVVVTVEDDLASHHPHMILRVFFSHNHHMQYLRFEVRSIFQTGQDAKGEKGGKEWRNIKHCLKLIQLRNEVVVSVDVVTGTG